MVPAAVGPNWTQLSFAGVCVSLHTRNGFFIKLGGADPAGGGIGAGIGLIIIAGGGAGIGGSGFLRGILGSMLCSVCA
jgi:hypothetical protein